MESPVLIWSIVSFLALITFLLLGVIFYLLAQKKFNITNVDVELESFLNQLYEASTKSNDNTKQIIKSFIMKLEGYDSSFDKINQSLAGFVNHVTKKIDDVNEDINSIKEYSLQKEEKIRRFEKGYDTKNINQFYKELFRILEFIKKEQLNFSSNVLNEIEEDILLLLENNGINRISLEKFKSDESLSRLTKVLSTNETMNKEDESTVHKIVKEGYYVQLNEEDIHVLKPVEVIINKYIEKD